ncbi:MAG: hypothetical protein RIQ37_619 [Actinomycetota bacterium]|jgi:predicted ArsR family transcriptional regulator
MWTFLTHHAHALLVISKNKDAKLQEIASNLGISERATIRVLNDLEEAGYLAKTRLGRRNHYEIASQAPLRHGSSKGRTIRDLVKSLSEINRGS